MDEWTCNIHRMKFHNLALAKYANWWFLKIRFTGSGLVVGTWVKFQVSSESIIMIYDFNIRELGCIAFLLSSRRVDLRASTALKVASWSCFPTIISRMLLCFINVFLLVIIMTSLNNPHDWKLPHRAALEMRAFPHQSFSVLIFVIVLLKERMGSTYLTTHVETDQYGLFKLKK